MFVKSLLATILLFSFTAQAAGYMRLGGSYSSEESGSQGSTSNQSRTLLDVGAGYIWPAGWTLGALYATEKEKNETSSTDRTGIGPTVGFIGQSPYILATYFLQLDREEMEGKGFQIDLGYRFSVGKISFAPQLTYFDVAYDENNGASMDPKYIEKKIDPYFVLWFEF